MKIRKCDCCNELKTLDCYEEKSELCEQCISNLMLSAPEFEVDDNEAKKAIQILKEDMNLLFV